MSETEKLRLFKHNEPLETNENKFDIDLALNQNWDKIEEFAGMVNDKVIELEDKDEEQDFNLQELQNEIKKDRENMINLEVEGQSIHIEDSSDLEGNLEVLGNMEQETSTQGKNKLNLRQANYTVAGVNVTKNYSKLTLNGTLNTSDNILDTVGDMYRFIYLGKFKVGTYRFSKFIISGKYTIDKNIGIGTYACYIRKKDKTLLAEIGGNASGGTGVTITLQEDTDLYMQIFCNAGAIFENCVLGFQLEEGEKTTDFEQFIPNMPSPEYPSEIRAVGDKGNVEIKKQNKNLFDILKYPFTNKVAYAPNGQLNYWTGYYGITEYFPVEENSNYVFSNDLNKPITYGLMFYNKNKEFISGIVENTTKFITPKNCKYIRFSIQSDTIPNKVQIEHGDKATEIVEHQEQTKILPIQKPMLEGDYFIKEADGWKEVHTWENKVINGTETMVDGNSPVADNTLVVSIPRKDSGLTNDKINIISEQFKGNTTANLWITDKEGISLSVGYISVRINRKRANTLEEVKEYLKQNNIKCFLKKSTENKLLCTPEQTKVLEELDNFQTYKPVTNITTDSIAKLKLKYIADTKTYVDNKVGNLEQQVNVINQLLSTTKTSSVLLDNLQTDIESEVI